MPWGVVAAAVVGGVMQNQAAKKGANASQKGTDATIAEERRQYDQTRTDQQPFLQAGYGALDRQNAYLNGDTSGFENSPDYKFAVSQGFKGLERSLASNLGTSSGGADADRMALGQGLATQYAGNYWSKLAGMAGQGYSAANNLGQLGAGMANQIGTANMQNANNRASAYQAQGNNWANTANQLGQAYMYKYGGRG